VGRHKVIVIQDGPASALPPGRPLSYRAVDGEQLTVHCLWLDEVPEPRTLPGRAWLVEGRPQWDDRNDGDAPGITRFSLLRRAKSISPSEFAAHWTDVHAPLARRHHPALRRYVQNIVLEPLGDAEPFDGIVELGFASVYDLEERMYDSEAGRATVAADVRSFIDVSAGWRVVTRDPLEN
jgi:uncharacterized protein (TIGR02118 family)